MELQDIQRLLGLLDDPNLNAHPVKTYNKSTSDLPAEFDAREEWDKCESIKEIRDQSNCGSCWAFGASEAFSDRLCIKSGQTNQTRISTTDPLSCCRTCGMGCNGGYLSSTWMYFFNTGAVSGGNYNDETTYCRNYPFPLCGHSGSRPSELPKCSDLEDYDTPKCEKECAPGYEKTYEEDIIKLRDYYRLGSEQDIMRALVESGPVEAGFSVYEDWLHYREGVYSHTSGRFLGGHAVKIIGYGEENGEKYWLIANSWNTTWGDKGFFKMKRGNNECGIEAQVFGGDVKLPENKTISQ